MSDDERVLRSFLAGDEEHRGNWTVTTAKRSKGHLPPTPVGEETVAVTDRRVLWFDDELEEVDLEAVDEIEGEYVEQTAQPPIVLGGSLLFVVGLFASIGAFLTNAGGMLIVAMPALTGFLILVGTSVFASYTGREGETREGHRIRLWTDDGAVSIWGHDEATMEDLGEAITAAAPAAAGEDGDIGDETPKAETAADSGDIEETDVAEAASDGDREESAGELTRADAAEPDRDGQGATPDEPSSTDVQ